MLYGKNFHVFEETLGTRIKREANLQKFVLFNFIDNMWRLSEISTKRTP